MAQSALSRFTEKKKKKGSTLGRFTSRVAPAPVTSVDEPRSDISEPDIDPTSFQGRGITSPIDVGISEVVGEEAVIKTRQAQTGFANVLADVLGAPAEFVGFLMQQTGLDIPDDPVAGQAAFRKFFSDIGVPDDEARTVADEITQRAFGEVAANIPILGAAGRAAQVTRPANLKKSVGVVRGIVNQFVKQFQKAPGATTAIETAGAAAFGLGAEGGERAAVALGAEEGGPAEQAVGFAGGLAASVVPSVVLGRVLRAGQGVLELFTPKGAGKGTTEEAVRLLAAQQLSDPRLTSGGPRELISDIEAGMLRETRFPGAQLSTGQLIDQPGLIALETHLASTDATFARTLSDNRAATNRALRDVVETMAPPDVRPAFTAAEIQGRIDRLKVASEKKIGALREGLEDVLASIRDPEEASRAVETFNQLAAAENKAQTDLLFNETRRLSSEAGAKFSPHKIIGAADSVTGGRIRGSLSEDFPDEILLEIERFRPTKKGQAIKDADFEELQELRSSIGQKIREEQAKGPSRNRKKIRNLITLQDATQVTLDDVGKQTKFKNVADAYNTARGFMASTAPIFREGIVGKIAAGGRNAPAPTAVLNQFIKAGDAGSEEAAQQFLALTKSVANNPKALENLAGSKADAESAVREFLMHQIFTTRDKAGDISVAAVTRQLKRYRVALKQFPALQKEFKNMARVRQRMDNMFGRVERTVRDVERGALRPLLDGDPGAAMQKAFRSPDPEKEIKRIMSLARKDPVAVDGVRRMVWDEFMLKVDDPSGVGRDISGTPLTNPERMRAFLGDNKRLGGRRDVLRAVGYTEKDLQLLDDAVNISEVLKNAPQERFTDVRGVLEAPRTAGEFVTKLISMPMIMSRVYALQRGVIGPRFAVSEAGGRLLRGFVNARGKDQLDAVLQKATVDPKFMRDLMQELTEKTAPIITGKIRAFLISEGLMTVEESLEDIKRQIDESINKPQRTASI